MRRWSRWGAWSGARRPISSTSRAKPRAGSATSRWRTDSQSASGCSPPTRWSRRWPGPAEPPATRGTRRSTRPSPPPTSWASSRVQRPETKARARALQLLYAWELSGRPSIETVVARVAGGFGHRPDGFDRGADLAAKAIAGLPEFDRRVADAAEHWRLERVAVVEKSILRLALAELAEGATPPRVVIDEAVKLAHWFAGAKAPAFVNGVLDAVAREYGAL